MCRHGRPMYKVCHDCPAEGRESNPEARAKEEHYDRLRKPGTTWDRLKSDPDKIAARRLYQVLQKYRKDYPDDPNPPPTTGADVTARRIMNNTERRRRESEEQARTLTDDELAELIGFAL